MRHGVTLITVGLLLFYPTSYAALRLTGVLDRTFFWSCMSNSSPKTGVSGPRALELLYHPLILVETSLPRSLQLG